MSNNIRYFLKLALTAVMVLVHTVAVAQEKEKIWTVSPFLGVSSPELKLLNEGEFKSPILGSGVLVFADDLISDGFFFLIDNDLPEIGFGTNAGLIPTDIE